MARRAMDTPLKNGYAYAHGQRALPYGRGSVAVAVHVFHRLGWPARAMGTPCRSRLGTGAGDGDRGRIHLVAFALRRCDGCGSERIFGGVPRVLGKRAFN